MKQDLEKLREPLNISQIDFRVQSINKGGYATILAYKDARVDMIRLDDCIGAGLWQKDYKVINDRLYCGVGIYNSEIHQWIWKWDVGTESNTEKEKGQASDSFKRACFNLGIGRELYEYPVISVKLEANEWELYNDKPRQTFNLKIKEWRWYSEFDNNGISFLAAKDGSGKVRFKWGTMAPKKEEPEYTAPSGALEEHDKELTHSQEPNVTDDSNAEGLLKKKAEVPEAPSKETPAVDPEREKAIADYELIFNKKPHHKTSTENILAEIAKTKVVETEKEPDNFVQELKDVKPDADVPTIEIEEANESVENLMEALTSNDPVVIETNGEATTHTIGEEEIPVVEAEEVPAEPIEIPYVEKLIAEGKKFTNAYAMVAWWNGNKAQFQLKLSKEDMDRLSAEFLSHWNTIK